MNCKQGDLAIIVGGIHGTQIGIVVTCLELLPTGSANMNPKWGPLWRVDKVLQHESGLGKLRLKPIAPDMVLMPINPLNDDEQIEATAESEEEV